MPVPNAIRLVCLVRAAWVFADRGDADRMLRDCLSDNPEWVEILEVVPVELELSLN